MKKLIGWVGGILATVIGGWLVFYFDQTPFNHDFRGYGH
jgi:hypothetical protein